MATPLVSSEEVWKKITPTTYRQVFNDNNLGEPDEDADLQIREDASSKVRATLGPTVPVDLLLASNEVFNNELRRLTLEVVHAMCAHRRPRLFPGLDPFELMQQAERQLEQVRTGYAQLGTDPDNPAGSDSDSGGGSVRVATTGRTDCEGRPIRFSDNWGDF